MPQASDEQRARWNGPDMAVTFLEQAGYKQTESYTWHAPDGHIPTERELDAIDFLCDEWDWGGLDDPSRIRFYHSVHGADATIEGCPCCFP